MLKKHMTPLTRGGALHVHKGKGSQMAPMPNREQISNLAGPPGASINDYSKATPMAQPMPMGPPGDLDSDGM